MDAGRLRIDLFAFALGALALLSAFFYGDRNGAALIMCALCLAGLLAARLAGFSSPCAAASPGPRGRSPPWSACSP